MSDRDLNVLHVIGGDTPSSRLETLRALRAQPDPDRQRVVQFGNGRIDHAGLGEIERVPTPFGVGRLARRSLQSMIPTTGRTIVHIWSINALNWVLSTARNNMLPASDHLRLLMEVEFPFDLSHLSEALSQLTSKKVLRFVCPTEAVRRRLWAIGVPPMECALIRDSFDTAAIDNAGRSDLRERLGFSADHAAVLILPPLRRDTGSLAAAWGAMLLEHARPGVRLIVPDVGHEVARVARLVESCRLRGMLRTVGRRFALPELLAAADLAVYLPSGDAPLSSVVWALAIGRPIVAGNVPVVTELLTHGRNAWLCRVNDPKDAARRMLQALEDQEQSHRQAELGSRQAKSAFSRRGMIAEYRRVYENLLTDRCLVEHLEEIALVR